MPIIVNKDDDHYLIAKKIFYDFELNQSCTVDGWITGDVDINKTQAVISKAEEVLHELERLDDLENVRSSGKKTTRKKVKPKNTIGGYLAHKIFKYNRTISDNQIKITIWRIQ